MSESYHLQGQTVRCIVGLRLQVVADTASCLYNIFSPFLSYWASFIKESNVPPTNVWPSLSQLGVVIWYNSSWRDTGRNYSMGTPKGWTPQKSPCHILFMPFPHCPGWHKDALGQTQQAPSLFDNHEDRNHRLGMMRSEDRKSLGLRWHHWATKTAQTAHLRICCYTRNINS